MSNVIEFSLKMVDDFSASMGKATSSISNMEKAFAALGVTALAYQAMDMARKSLDNAEAMGTMAEKANMQVEAFSALVYAANQSNVETGSLTNGLKMLNKAMSEGASTDAGFALQSLGVSAKDAAGNLRPVEQVLFDVADAFKAAGADADKTQYALTLFGRSGLDMVPMLNQGSGAITEMMDKAKKLGLVISSDFARSADQLNDNLATLGGVISGSVNVAMAEVAPVIEQMTGQMINLATEGDNVAKAGQVIATGLRLIMSAGILVVGTFNTVGEVIGGVMAQLVLLAQGEFKAAANVTVMSDAMDNMRGTLAEVNKVWDESAQAANASTAQQANAIRKAGEGMDNLTEKKKLAEAAEKRHAAAVQEASSIIGSQMSLLEEHQAMIAHINMLKAEGAMTSDQAALALERENEQWLQSSARVAEYGMTATSVMESLQTLVEQKQAVMQSYAMQYAQMMLATFDQLSKGIGDSVADAIVDGASLMDAIGNMLKQIVKNMISTWVQLQVQRVIYAALGSETEAMAATSRISSQAGVVYTATYADVAENMDYGWLYGAAIAAAAAAAAEAGGLAFVGAGQAAHGGLDFVPNESTFLLQQGERVLSPRQNEDLTSFLEGGGSAGGGVTIENLTIHVLENATNVDAFTRMDKIQLRNALGYPVVDALNEMWNIGIRPDFASGAR